MWTFDSSIIFLFKSGNPNISKSESEHRRLKSFKCFEVDNIGHISHELSINQSGRENHVADTSHGWTVLAIGLLRFLPTGPIFVDFSIQLNSIYFI